MKFLYFFIFLFVLGSIFTIQIRKDKNSKSIPVKEAKFLSMQCMLKMILLIVLAIWQIRHK